MRYIANFNRALLVSAATAPLLMFGGCQPGENLTHDEIIAADRAAPVVPRDAVVEARILDIIAEMSLEEKAAQMRVFHANKGIELGGNNELILSEDVQERLKLGTAGIKNPGEFLAPEKAAILNN